MKFKDWDQLSDDLKPIVEYLVQQELISGYTDGTIRPSAPVERWQMFFAIHKLARWIERLAEEHADQDRLNLMRLVANYVVEVQSSEGLGSGVLISGGRILTNAHVVGDDPAVLVRWTSPLADSSMPKFFDKKYPVVKRHVSYDLAMIQTDISTSDYAELDPAWVSTDMDRIDRTYFGQSLYAIGSPVGLSGVPSRGYFAGHKFFGSNLYLVFMGSINPGNSGGPIFNLEGKLVSLVTAKPADALVDGVGFGVPPLAIDYFLNSQD